MLMKHVSNALLATLITSWTVAEQVPTLSFDNAVRESIETEGQHSHVVITVDTNSAMAIAKRSVKIDGLKAILSVTGLTETPPAILIRAHNKAPNQASRDLIDGLTKAGMWRISFEEVSGDLLYSKKLPSEPRPNIQSAQRTDGTNDASSPFAEAVRASFKSTAKETPHVVVMIDKDGAVSIAGLPVRLSQLKNIRSVSGLSEYPPFILVQVHDQSKDPAAHEAVCDRLTAAGMTQIACFSISASEWDKRMTQYTSGAPAFLRDARSYDTDEPRQAPACRPNPNGDWSANIPDVGKVAIRFRPSNPDRCELFWVFRCVSVPLRQEGERLILGSPSNEIPNLRLSIGEDDLLHFHAGGLIDENRWDAYRNIVFHPLPPGGYENIADFRRAGSEYQKYNDHGDLQPLPPELPGWIMNVAAYLFADDNRTLPALLRHRSLEPATLAFLADFISKKQNVVQQLSLIAAHPNTPVNTLEKLFEYPEAPLVWHSVAQNPRMKAGYYERYLSKVKRSDTKVLWQVARDPDCPPELLVWVFEQTKDSFLKNEIIRHHNTPAIKLRAIFAEQPFDQTRQSLAANRSLPDDLMLSVIQTNDKHTLWAAQKNPNISTQALDQVLHRLATHPDFGTHDSVLSDCRITPAVVAILMTELDQRSRMLLARNTALALEDLITLAKDPYRVVSLEAREQLKNRFPQQAKHILPGLKDPLLLNPSRDKAEELSLAITNKDLPSINTCCSYFAHNCTTQPGYSQTFGPALRTRDVAVMATLLQHFPSFPAAQAVKDDAMDRHWLDFLHGCGILEKDPLGFLEASIRYAKPELCEYLLDKGLDVNVQDDNGRTLLIHALKFRNLQTVESLLAHGANPDIPDKEGLLAVDYAARAYLISIVRRLDSANKYEKFLADFGRRFPPQTNSPILGTWSNQKDGFHYACFAFYNDGTGLISTSVMTIMAAWRSPRPGEIELQPIEANGPSPKQQMSFRYRVSENTLTMSDGKTPEAAEYHRIPNNTQPK